MISSVGTYALRETTVEAIQYWDNDIAFRHADDFTRGHVFKRRDGTILLEGHDAKRVKIEPGDYIVKVNGCFYRYTEKELKDHYLKVGD